MRTDDLSVGLDLVADVLIPPTPSRPAPSALRLGADLLGRLRETERSIVQAALTAVGAQTDFSLLTDEQKEDRLTRLEADEPAVFDVLRRCVYFAYYAQPAVVRRLREEGYDVNESPQPRGYAMDPFDEGVVKKVDRNRQVWIPASRVGQLVRQAS